VSGLLDADLVPRNRRPRSLLDNPDPVDDLRERLPARPARYGAELTMPSADVRPLDTVDPTARMSLRAGVGQTVGDTARLYQRAIDAAGWGGSVRAFHGTFAPNLRQLDNARLGENFNNRASRAGHWFSTNPDDAAFYGDNIYEAVLEGRFRSLPSMEEIGSGVVQRLETVAENQNISYEARQRAKAFLEYLSATRDPSFFTNSAASEISKARRAGYDGAVLRGGETVQTNSRPGDNYVVFDPANARIKGRYEP
jgi:hypothetical protein